MSLRLHAGPVTEETPCDHGGPTLPSDPDDIDLITKCEVPAVVHTPWPSKNVVGTVVLCEWHLARLLDDYPDLEAKLREIFAEQDDDLDAYLSPHAFLGLADVPAVIDPHHLSWQEDDLSPAVANTHPTWIRIGLDQRGAGHYTSQSRDVVMVVDAELNVEQVQELDRKTLRDWLEVARMARGWAELDHDRVEYYAGGDEADA